MDPYNIGVTEFLGGFTEKNFESMVQELARQNKIMTITQNGKPVAVMLSPEDYEELKKAYLIEKLKEEFPGAEEVDG